MNLADSERMAGVLEELGYSHTESANDANLVVYNTCSIRDKSEHKVRTAGLSEATLTSALTHAALVEHESTL